jgi:hypothetical protein
MTTNVVAIVVAAAALLAHPVAMAMGHSGAQSLIAEFVSWVAHFESMRFQLIGPIGISVLDFCGSMVVCRGYRDNIRSKKSVLEALVSCTLMQFGGTTITGALLGQTPSWIMSFYAPPAFLLAFWLTFCAPSSALLASSISPMLYDILEFGAAISGGHAITSWGVDKALSNTFHVNPVRISQSTLVCILSGTFSGCGGGLLGDWLGVLKSPSFTFMQTPSVFRLEEKRASSTLTKAFVLACLYYCLVTHDYVPALLGFEGPFLSKDEGHAVIVAMNVLNHTIKAIFPKIDLFVETFQLLQKLLLVPADIPCKPEGRKAMQDEKQKGNTGKVGDVNTQRTSSGGNIGTKGSDGISSGDHTSSDGSTPKDSPSRSHSPATAPMESNLREVPSPSD